MTSTAEFYQSRCQTLRIGTRARPTCGTAWLRFPTSPNTTSATWRHARTLEPIKLSHIDISGRQRDEKPAGTFEDLFASRPFTKELYRNDRDSAGRLGWL